MDVGLPGPNAGKGGKHVILPPGYMGEVPAGYQVGRSSSYKVLLAVRALPVGGNVPAAMDALRKIKIYPLATATEPVLMKFVDTTEKAMDSSSLRWEGNLQFWEVLHRIVDAEPLVDKFLPMYGVLANLGIEKGKPFAPDARMKSILESAAIEGRGQMLVSAFDSMRPDRLAWPDRKWEWVGLVPGSAQFETPAGIDLDARDRWFAQAIVTSPAMFRRTAGAGSLYWLAARDLNSAYLDGGKNYRLAISQPVPDKLFWSVTVYDAERAPKYRRTRTRRRCVAVRTEGCRRNGGDQSLFRPRATARTRKPMDQDRPGKGWFAYIRIYGPEQGRSMEAGNQEISKRLNEQRPSSRGREAACR